MNINITFLNVLHTNETLPFRKDPEKQIKITSKIQQLMRFKYRFSTNTLSKIKIENAGWKKRMEVLLLRPCKAAELPRFPNVLALYSQQTTNVRVNNNSEWTRTRAAMLVWPPNSTAAAYEILYCSGGILRSLLGGSRRLNKTKLIYF